MSGPTGRLAPARMTYRFAARPRWILVHIVVALMVSFFASAGLWQLSRLDQRREHNALVRERRAMAPVTSLEGRDVEHRRVQLRGRYDIDELVVLAGRTSRGRTGNHLLTPLRLDGDGAVIVDRGWVPADTPHDAVDAPSGEVEIEGVALPSERTAPLGSGRGEVDRVARIDIERLDGQVPYRLAPVYVLLSQQHPPQVDDIPVPGDLAELSEGSHLSYAAQWFIFIPIALVVYGALLRREARKRSVQASSAPE